MEEIEFQQNQAGATADEAAEVAAAFTAKLVTEAKAYALAK